MDDGNGRNGKLVIIIKNNSQINCEWPKCKTNSKKKNKQINGKTYLLVE